MPATAIAPPIGVLLLQLGTPAAPTAAALRPYLRQFLSDPRVIELPRPLWWLILNLFILPFRPGQSAAKYARIWSPEHGSPLLHYSRRQAELLARELGPGFAVALGMSYGEPSTGTALAGFDARGVERVLAFPLYPQYSGPSTASALDAVFAALGRRRVLPALRVVPPFPTDTGYLDALAARHRETLAGLAAAPEHTILSFHGLPQEMIDKGDPYRRQCEATYAALVARLALDPGRTTLAFQSRFGRAEWLRPYLDEKLEELARAGVRRVLIQPPGFAADCLETLDELGNEYGHLFRTKGGATLSLVPALNDHPAWIQAMAAMVRRETSGWFER